MHGAWALAATVLISTTQKSAGKHPSGLSVLDDDTPVPELVSSPCSVYYEEGSPRVAEEEVPSPTCAIGCSCDRACSFVVLLSCGMGAGA